jgi:cytochrome c oxidase subunit IV
MTQPHRHLLLGLVGLLLLAGVEFAGLYLPLPRPLRPLLMLPALAMVALVALRFMRVGTGPAIVRVFAIAGLFWLLILLGLGSMDPLTRAVDTVRTAQLP